LLNVFFEHTVNSAVFYHVLPKIGRLMFDYVLALLNTNIHKHPPEYQDEVDFIKEILTKGQGYLTKDKPVRVIFFDRNAKQ